MSIKGFIFDLDGTLLDSMKIWHNAGSDYLAGQRVENIPEDLREIIKAMSLLQSAQYFIREFRLPYSEQEVMDGINEMIENKYRLEVLPKEGVTEFLENHKHMRMCIATATDKHLVEYALERLGIARYFDFIITSTEVGSSKENPDIFFKAAERMNLKQEEVIIFEDAVHAIRSAKEAGFRVVAVADEYSLADEEQIRQLADQFVKRLSELEM